jgi:hypothetical protein
MTLASHIRPAYGYGWFVQRGRRSADPARNGNERLTDAARGPAGDFGLPGAGLVSAGVIRVAVQYPAPTAGRDFRSADG